MDPYAVKGRCIPKPFWFDAMNRLNASKTRYLTHIRYVLSVDIGPNQRVQNDQPLLVDKRDFARYIIAMPRVEPLELLRADLVHLTVDRYVISYPIEYNDNFYFIEFVLLVKLTRRIWHSMVSRPL